MIYSYLCGQLGNILFEIAAGASLAKRMNVPFKALTCYSIDMPEYIKPFRKSILRNIDFSDKYPKNQKIYQESDLTYSPLPEEKELLIKGYFQSEKYFDKELVRELFKIDTEMASYLHNKYGHVLARNPVSIQVRRGDYLKSQHIYPVCRMSYYKKAMSNFPPDTVFLVMSDDIDWCRKHFRGNNFFFSDAESPVIVKTCFYGIVNKIEVKYYRPILQKTSMIINMMRKENMSQFDNMPARLCRLVHQECANLGIVELFSNVVDPKGSIVNSPR